MADEVKGRSNLIEQASFARPLMLYVSIELCVVLRRALSRPIHGSDMRDLDVGIMDIHTFCVHLPITMQLSNNDTPKKPKRGNGKIQTLHKESHHCVSRCIYLHIGHIRERCFLQIHDDKLPASFLRCLGHTARRINTQGRSAGHVEICL
jgi:hypothetical protein